MGFCGGVQWSTVYSGLESIGLLGGSVVSVSFFRDLRAFYAGSQRALSGF